MTKTFLFLALFFFAMVPSVLAESYQVVFETLDCAGSSGFATVGVETIYKIEEADCSHPDHPGEKLKQLLVHDSGGSYSAYTLSQDEAKAVMLEVKAYMKAKRNLLERSDAIIVQP